MSAKTIVMSPRWWVVGMICLLMLVVGGSGDDALAAQPAHDYTSCGHFETQEGAQEVLDSGVLDDPSVLDWDGDGIACEEVFGAPVTTLPATGAGIAGVAVTDFLMVTLIVAGGIFAGFGMKLRGGSQG